MRRAALLLSLVALTSACASTPTPTYRDYEVRARPASLAESDTTLTGRLYSAVVAAGWTPVPSLSPGIVTTAPRAVSGAFSRTTASLDLVPVDGGRASEDAGGRARFVRVVVRAERRSVLGGRSKVYALDGRLREQLLGPLTEALAARGLVALGTPRDRDEDATDG